MKKVSLILTDSKGFVLNEYSVNVVNNRQSVILVIDDREYYIDDNGELILHSQPHDIFIVTYGDNDKQNLLTYTLRARNDKEALRQAMLNTEFYNKLDMKTFDKKYLKAYKVKFYKNSDIGKVMYFEGDPKI